MNNIKAKHPGNRIAALDFNRGIAIVEVPGGAMKAVNFDTATLAIKD